MFKLCTVFLAVLAVSAGEDKKWSWNSQRRSDRDREPLSSDYPASSKAKYEIQEFQEGHDVRPDLKPHDFKYPDDYRQNYPYLNRPVGFGGPGGLGGPGGSGAGFVGGAGFGGSFGQRPFGHLGGGGPHPGGPGLIPGEGHFPGGPGPFPGAPHGPGFGPNGLIPHEGPFKHFESCKCTERFNCPAPGFSYGNCDVAKSYCCYPSKTGPLPAQPVNSVANGILVGPGGPVDPPIDHPGGKPYVGIRPFPGGVGAGIGPGGLHGGPVGGLHGGAGGPIGGPFGGPGVQGGVYGAQGGVQGGVYGGVHGGHGGFQGGVQVGISGAGGVYGGGAGGYGGGFGFGRPLPGPLGPRPVHSPENGVLVGPGGPLDPLPGPLHRPPPFGPGSYGSYGPYGHRRNFGGPNENSPDIQGDDVNAEAGTSKPKKG